LASTTVAPRGRLRDHHLEACFHAAAPAKPASPFLRNGVNTGQLVSRPTARPLLRRRAPIAGEAAPSRAGPSVLVTSAAALPSARAVSAAAHPETITPGLRTAVPTATPAAAETATSSQPAPVPTSTALGPTLISSASANVHLPCRGRCFPRSRRHASGNLRYRPGLPARPGAPWFAARFNQDITRRPAGTCPTSQ